jgi:ABC-type antimicrobial peptide transport system ATPase subunit
MNIASLNPVPQAAAPPAGAPESAARPKKKRRATGEQIRRLVREGSDCSDPITVAQALINEHPELLVSSFRWLVRQVAWALALEQLRDVGVTTHRPRRSGAAAATSASTPR